jgi:two-component system cell cycle sensor histidine kinase/response regulator CckA
MSSPLQALELYRKKTGEFDLVITDLTMPEMTGIELTKELHNINPQLPVILMTGYEKDIEYTIPLSDYGICQFLKKPVTMTQMATTINDVILGTNATTPL